MENAIPGLKVESLENGAVMAYTLSSAQSSTISAWSNLAVSTLTDWPKDRPYLALHDLSHPGVGLLYLTAVEFDPFNVGVTQVGRQKVHEIMAAQPGWPVVLALVVSTSLSGRLTRLRMADIISDLPKITSRTFFKRAAALEWLLQHRVKQPVVEAAQPVAAPLPITVISSTPTLSPVAVAPASASTQPESTPSQPAVQIEPKAVT